MTKTIRAENGIMKGGDCHEPTVRAIVVTGGAHPENAQGEKITRAEYLVLEKLFLKEIERALGPQWTRDMPTQIKSKYLPSLEEKGLVVKRVAILDGALPVMVKGWELTLAGNFAYCMNCYD